MYADADVQLGVATVDVSNLVDGAQRTDFKEVLFPGDTSEPRSVGHFRVTTAWLDEDGWHAEEEWDEEEPPVITWHLKYQEDAKPKMEGPRHLPCRDSVPCSN